MKLWNRILHFVRRQSAKRELEEEIAVHRAMTEDRLRREGVSHEEARASAARVLGNATLALEESRSAWNFAWLESLAGDTRYALRCFRRAPLFSATVILTIGLALGLNTVLFTAFNAYVLAPFAVQDPYALYQFWWNTQTVYGGGLSWTEFQELRRHNPAFSDVLAVRAARVRMNDDMLLGQLVSGNYFSMLGVSPALGRTILPSDAVEAGGNPVIVLSFDCWKGKFGQDPSVIGRIISLHGHPFEIVGVARSGFAGITISPQDFWAPMTMYSQLLDGPDLFGPENPHTLEVTGRLSAGISLEQARSALLVYTRQLTADRAEPDRAISIGFASNATWFPLTPETISQFAPAFIAFGLVLLLACTNVANMMLARAMSRQREIGVRLALGAARPRLIRQLLTEGIVLALGSAGFGFAFAWLSARVGVRAFLAFIPAAFAKRIHVAAMSFDWRVFLFVLVAACISAIGFALAPALQATRGDLVSAARGNFTSRHQTGRLRNILITAQVTICVLLLISSGVLLRAGQRVEAADVGLDVRNVVEMDVREGFLSRAATLLSADPNVETVAADWRTPLYGSLRGISVAPENDSSFAIASYNYVSPEHFDVFRVALTRGRNFTADEGRAEAPVVIVSEATARHFWPNMNALGQTLRIQPPPLEARPEKIPQYTAVRVIGIARDVVNQSVIFGPDITCIYFPTSVNGASLPSLLVRVHGNPELAARSMQKLLDERVPGAVTQMTPMQEVLDIQYLPFRIFSLISDALVILALILTIAGIYGVISYLVAQRSREIGIRIALGASSLAVVRLVLLQSVRVTFIGLGTGMLLAVAVVRILASKVQILRPHDIAVYVASTAIVLVAAILAAAIPARRASRLDPMSILRHD